MEDVRPNHYKQSSLEAWDAMQHLMSYEEYIGGLKFNIFKYLSRANHKHDCPLSDYKKALEYLNKMITTIEEEPLKDCIYTKHHFNGKYSPYKGETLKETNEKLQKMKEHSTETNQKYNELYSSKG